MLCMVEQTISFACSNKQILLGYTLKDGGIQNQYRTANTVLLHVQCTLFLLCTIPLVKEDEREKQCLKI